MPTIVKIVHDQGGPHVGRYVKSWNSNTPYGVLEMTSTADPAEAKRFATVGAAIEEYRAASEVAPIRPSDGGINRPLTGLSITFEAVPDGK